jgi:hypothetical protein
MNRLLLSTVAFLTGCSAVDDGRGSPDSSGEPPLEAASSARVLSSASSSAADASAPAPAPPVASTSSHPRPAPAPPANDASLHPPLKAIAGKHDSFSRADGTWWSLLGCLAPPPVPVRFSDAPAESDHGRKLYTLKIYDFEAYARDTKIPTEKQAAAKVRGPLDIPGVSQAIVKESFEVTRDPAERHVMFVDTVTKDGVTFYAREPRDLFVMFRPADGRLETDAGWLYGTVDPNGAVTSAGRVASCMGCHANAPHGRLFGPRASD